METICGKCLLSLSPCSYVEPQNVLSSFRGHLAGKTKVWETMQYKETVFIQGTLAVLYRQLVILQRHLIKLIISY